MVETFLKYLAYEKRYVQHTLTSYELDLRQFSDFLVMEFEINSPQDAQHMHLRSWIISLVGQKISSRTVNRKLAALRSYYKFLLKREIISEDPCRKLKALKTEKKLPSFVREEQLNTMFENVQFSDDLEGSREQLIMELLYGTGIRLAELLAMKEENIDFDQQQIRVLGKRSKERIIPFSQVVKNALERYIYQKNRSGFNNGNGYLFVNNKGNKAYPMLIYRTVKKYLSNIRHTDKTSPHVLRHTFATHLLNKGADLNAVKDLLGHSSLAATQVYTHNTLDKLKAVFDQAHPKA